MTVAATSSGNAPRVNLEASRRYCRDLTRAAAKNFYYGLRLLPEPKRSAMYALYAWMRLVDDIADQEDGRTIDRRIEELEAWRQTTHNALGAACGFAPPPAQEALKDSNLLWPAFRDMVARHNVPAKVFDEVIAGQEQDLQPLTF